MIDIKKIEQGFLIEGKLYFSDGDCQKDYINLFMKKGGEMNYGCVDTFKIDFPGEYDKDGILMVCYVGDENKLNYFIRIDEKYFAIIQNPKMVENEDFQGVTDCIYTDDYTLKHLEKLEFEGESMKLEESRENTQIVEETNITDTENE